METTMTSGEGVESSDDKIVVELDEIGSGNQSTRRGGWELIEDY